MKKEKFVLTKISVYIDMMFSSYSVMVSYILIHIGYCIVVVY